MASPPPSSHSHCYSWAHWLLPRGLGCVYLIAFLSLWLQIEGLVGSQGILPVDDFLIAARQQLGVQAYGLFPTLCWFSSSDAFLHFLCALGVVLALLVAAGWLQSPALFGLWASYLSLTTVGRHFLSFQWDALLLEAGFLAIFLVPVELRSRRTASPPPSPWVVWLLRWLLFRLMFSSGVVKLTSGDPSWHGLRALDFHYETQPLPTWIAWYVHGLPNAFHTASVVAVLAIEILIPFLVLAPPRYRRLAFVPLVGLQLLIALTGNYGFFNLLSVLLCILLLDDNAWPLSRLQSWIDKRTSTTSRTRSDPGREARRWPWPRWSLVTLAVGVLLLSGLELARSLRVTAPGALAELHRWTTSWRTVNGYGLFAVMTTRRPEIVIQGSYDGQVWRAYEFRYKPGAPQRRPRIVAPYQPRLDWQMWFAALGTYRENPWFLLFMARLAEGSLPVRHLLASDNPFAETPPSYLRARVYDYRFSDAAHRRETGEWWVREDRGAYLPEVPAKTLLHLLPIPRLPPRDHPPPPQ